MFVPEQEASVSDPISVLGNQNPLAAAAPALSSPPGGMGQAAPPLSATTSAQAPATPATQLEFSAASGASQAPAAPTTMTMEEAAAAYQTYLSSLPSNLQFQPDTQSGLTVIKVVNPVTNKVIRQLPSADAIQQAQFLRNSGTGNHSGILLDQSL
jgi:flagellar protein FlaG